MKRKRKERGSQGEGGQCREEERVEKKRSDNEGRKNMAKGKRKG